MINDPTFDVLADYCYERGQDDAGDWFRLRAFLWLGVDYFRPSYLVDVRSGDGRTHSCSGVGSGGILEVVGRSKVSHGRVLGSLPRLAVVPRSVSRTFMRNPSGYAERPGTRGNTRSREFDTTRGD